jgi:hypothetical protein
MARPKKPRRPVKKRKNPRIKPLAEESLQAWTKLIAISVRNEMEEIHAQHIPDDLMPDLNRAIRRGIYLALRNIFLMTNATNVVDYYRAKAYLWFLFTTLPDYWEDTVLTPEDLAEEDARPGHMLLNMPPVHRAFQAWLYQHAFLWVEGQKLSDESPGGHW